MHPDDVMGLTWAGHGMMWHSGTQIYNFTYAFTHIWIHHSDPGACASTHAPTAPHVSHASMHGLAQALSLKPMCPCFHASMQELRQALLPPGQHGPAPPTPPRKQSAGSAGPSTSFSSQQSKGLIKSGAPVAGELGGKGDQGLSIMGSR